MEFGIQSLLNFIQALHSCGGNFDGDLISSLNNCLERIMTSSNAENTYQSALMLIPTSVWCKLISSVVACALSEDMEMSQTLEFSRRRSSLQCLWLLTLHCATASANSDGKLGCFLSDCFHADQSWLDLLTAALPTSASDKKAVANSSASSCLLERWWSAGDPESVLLLSGAVSNWAAAGSTAEMVSERNRIAFAGFLYNKMLIVTSSGSRTRCLPASFDMGLFLQRASGSGLGVLDPGPLLYLAALAAEKAQSLPSLLLLLLCHCLFRSSYPARSLCVCAPV
jgi:hypothetical protein